jgi:HAD superfamily hydrolase (TIGR01509 family)
MIIFDLDGVIVDSRELHFEALNLALEEIDSKFIITKEEHSTTFDGLPTLEKLKILSKERGLSKELHKKINERKQQHTIQMMSSYQHDSKLMALFSYLKSINQTICVASNSIRATIDLVLEKKGLSSFVSYIVSNEDVSFPKPNPQMYLMCMSKFGVSPKDTYIVEDSYFGRIAAYESGATVIQVKNSKEVTLQLIKDNIKERTDKMKWKNKNLNILIPMAGEGSRFKQVGYTVPKPMIEINGKPMIQHVVDNLNIDANFIFCIRKDHEEQFNISEFIKKFEPSAKFVIIDSLTEGAACTTLLAKELIDNEQELMIVNSDQLVVFNSNEFYHAMNNENIDGSILTFESDETKWSYVSLDEHNKVTNVVEKEVISNHATVGMYYWSKGSNYVKYAQQMINKNIRYGHSFNGKGEFYVAPVYNEAIKEDKVFRIYDVERMIGLGTPEDMENYKNELG